MADHDVGRADPTRVHTGHHGDLDSGQEASSIFMQHHDAAVERFITKASLDPDVLAVVVDGSVASGLERPDSDVDLVLIVTDDAFQRALDADRLSYVDDTAGYADGYYDIKVATLAYLDRAAQRSAGTIRCVRRSCTPRSLGVVSTGSRAESPASATFRTSSGSSATGVQLSSTAAWAEPS